MAAQKLAKEQLIVWREKLLSEKNEALRIINDINGIIKERSKLAASEGSNSSVDNADYASSIENRETQAYIMEKERKRIDSINAALKRIYEESFGICKICGDAIPEARLKIIPFAKYCITCQEKEEAQNR